MTENNSKKYYNGLLGIMDVFDKTTPKAEDIELNLVREYSKFLDDANKELTIKLVEFIPDDYFSFSNGQFGTFYRSPGIKAHIQRNLGILKTELETTNQTTLNVSKSFHFIKDKLIRSILERDYLEIQGCIYIKSWKATIILSGGSIEAILLDLLSKNSVLVQNSNKKPQEQELNRWDLNDLINVAVELKLVDSKVAELSHTVRAYRNLIHPGNEIRSDLSVEQEEANIAFNTLNMLIRELS